jgi:hypothetical protein
MIIHESDNYETLLISIVVRVYVYDNKLPMYWQKSQTPRRREQLADPML